MTKKYYLLTLLALGLLTHFIFLTQPDKVVFDEVHFGKFVSSYFTHQFYFDIHPPLGKMMIAGFAKLFDFKPGFAFANIGDVYPDKQYMILRALPNLAGALLPVVMFLILIELGLEYQPAFLGGLLVTFENGVFVQSHYILLDAFLLLFGFTSFLFYLKYRNTKDTYHLLASGIFAGLALSIKWTGLSFLGLPLLFEGYEMISEINRDGLRTFEFKKVFLLIAAFIVIPVVIYFTIFGIDFRLLYKDSPADTAVGPGFRKTLEDNNYASDASVKPSSVLQKFFEINIAMYESNNHNNVGHPFASKWFEWPLMAGSIDYWVADENTPANGPQIDLMGNPIVWSFGTATVIMLLFGNLSFRPNPGRKTELLLLGGYFANLLPFVTIKRTMFLYHYLAALVFAIIILSYWLSRQEKGMKLFSFLAVFSIIAFFLMAPLSYGVSSTPAQYQAGILMEKLFKIHK